MSEFHEYITEKIQSLYYYNIPITPSIIKEVTCEFDEQRPNLIEASRHMYEVLKRLVEESYPVNAYEVGMDRPVYDDVLKALAKAEGKDQ